MKINEIFYSIQGEGKNTGEPTVFVRLAGCNLSCEFCDTKHALNTKKEMQVKEIINEVKKYKSKWACITGGEPFIQDIRKLSESLGREGFLVQIETNGTVFQDVKCDWLVVSPKKERLPDDRMLLRSDEIKVVIDSAVSLENIGKFAQFSPHLSLQPVNNNEELTMLCIDFLKENPEWRLSVQLHKILNIR